MSWVAKKALRPTAIIIGVLALAVIAGIVLRSGLQPGYRNDVYAIRTELRRLGGTADDTEHRWRITASPFHVIAYPDEALGTIIDPIPSQHDIERAPSSIRQLHDGIDRSAIPVAIMPEHTTEGFRVDPQIPLAQRLEQPLQSTTVVRQVLLRHPSRGDRERRFGQMPLGCLRNPRCVSESGIEGGLVPDEAHRIQNPHVLHEGPLSDRDIVVSVEHVRTDLPVAGNSALVEGQRLEEPPYGQGVDASVNPTNLRSDDVLDETPVVPDGIVLAYAPGLGPTSSDDQPCDVIRVDVLPGGAGTPLGEQ